MTKALWPEALKSRGLQSNSPLARLMVQGTLDAVAWIIAVLLAAVLVNWQSPGTLVMAAVAGLATVAQLAIGWLLFLYRNRYPYGGFAEIRFVALSALLVGICLVVASLVDQWRLNWTFAVTAMFIAAVLMVASRHLLRALLDRQKRPMEGQRVLLVGAGETGSILIRQMRHDTASEYQPVALVDDDLAKRNLRIDGVPVKGTTSDLLRTATLAGAEGVIVAITTAGAPLMRELNDQLEASGIWIRIVPPLEELVHGQVAISSIRELNVEDLIGRQPVETDLETIREHIAGKRVLVTGAGGSIGSELCRQLHGLEPAELMMLDRDESALHALQMTIHGRALMTGSEVVLADIRDPQALQEIFADRKPEVVFHAAALKHLPMLEQYPLEGWKTNVYGTLNVLEAAKSAGVASFINVSTDKAASPTSVLGRTKRIAERLTSAYADATGQSYLSVRFGNVLGSRGSVLLSFQTQIANGGPVTITHPDVTRYFMTIPEACQLVLQAAVIGHSRETLVLDMGEPVKIIDIAYRLMRLANRNCDIVYTGLREGEKLDEDLFTALENGQPGPHEKISHCLVAPLQPAMLPSAEADLETIVTFSAVASMDVASTGPGKENPAKTRTAEDGSGQSASDYHDARNKTGALGEVKS